MRAIPLQLTCRIDPCDAAVLENPEITGKQVCFVKPPGFRVESRSQEVSDIADSFSNANKLPIEKSWLGFMPE